MLKIDYKRTVKERVRARCSRHPKYNPEKDGKAGLQDRCATCYALLELHEARLMLDDAIRHFERRAAPWVGVPRTMTRARDSSPSLPSE